MNMNFVNYLKQFKPSEYQQLYQEYQEFKLYTQKRKSCVPFSEKLRIFQCEDGKIIWIGRIYISHQSFYDFEFKKMNGELSISGFKGKKSSYKLDEFLNAILNGSIEYHLKTCLIKFIDDSFDKNSEIYVFPETLIEPFNCGYVYCGIGPN